jgi:maltose-binding protein MalE
MATYRVSLRTKRSQEQLFDYMARFSHAVLWDPSVISAREGTPGIVALGSEYHLNIKTRNSTVPFTYTIIELESPRRVVLEAITNTFYARDTITVRAIADNESELNYEATLRLRGFAAIFGIVLIVAFRRIGSHVKQGLCLELDAQ